MSLNTSVYTGWIIKAKMSTINETVTKHGCTKDSSHSNVWDAKFCTKCGSPVGDIEVPEVNFKSLYDLSFEPDEQTVPQQTVLEKFDPCNSVWIGFDEEGYELLVLTTPEHPGWLDADDEGVHFFESNFVDIQPPTQEWLDLLKGAMEYESIELKFGTLVSVS